MTSDMRIPHFDPQIFSTNSYVRRIDKPWGYELHWVPEDAPYMGKVIHIDENKRLSLQVHDQKQESWFIISGKGAVIWEDSNGQLVETILEAGKGYTTRIGQKHRLRDSREAAISSKFRRQKQALLGGLRMTLHERTKHPINETKNMPVTSVPKVISCGKVFSNTTVYKDTILVLCEY